MVKIYFLFSFLIISVGLQAQGYPYLNASTANENEFPVDKDTNIYMFHGNRLVKTDKNFNTIWANTYSGFTFSSLLLSKTGSIYFIGSVSAGAAKFFYGKINPNGTLSWVKNTQSISAVLSGTGSVTYAVECNKLLLDRNNNLVVSGHAGTSTPFTKGFLIKSDTSGNSLKFKCFNPGTSTNYLNKLAILNDSMGYYRFIGSAYFAMGPAIQLAMYTYNDNTDFFTGSRYLSYINIPFGFEWRLIRSKINSDFYIHFSEQDVSSYVINGLGKFSKDGQMKWRKTFSRLNGSLYAFAGHLEESNNGDLFLTMTTGNALQFYNSAFVKADSNGVLLSSASAILNGYNIAPTYIPPINSTRVIHTNNYYFDVSGNNFPSNPLTIQKFNSSLVLPCSAVMNYSLASSSNFSMTVNTPTLAPIMSYTIPSFSSTVSLISFSVNTNFCIVMGEKGTELEEDMLSIYPNPVADKLNIINKNHTVESIEVFDLNGRTIKSFEGVSSIDVSNFSNGIYFIHIKTDKGEFKKKFIKE